MQVYIELTRSYACRPSSSSRGEAQVRVLGTEYIGLLVAAPQLIDAPSRKLDIIAAWQLGTWQYWGEPAPCPPGPWQAGTWKSNYYCVVLKIYSRVRKTL